MLQVQIKKFKKFKSQDSEVRLCIIHNSSFFCAAQKYRGGLFDPKTHLLYLNFFACIFYIVVVITQQGYNPKKIQNVQGPMFVFIFILPLFKFLSLFVVLWFHSHIILFGIPVSAIQNPFTFLVLYIVCQMKKKSSKPNLSNFQHDKKSPAALTL